MELLTVTAALTIPGIASGFALRMWFSFIGGVIVAFQMFRYGGWAGRLLSVLTDLFFLAMAGGLTWLAVFLWRVDLRCISPATLPAWPIVCANILVALLFVPVKMSASADTTS